jgi:hypothetical protein
MENRRLLAESCQIRGGMHTLEGQKSKWYEAFLWRQNNGEE